MLKGEIWLLNLDPTVGAEIQKTRPVVIINQDALGILPLRVVVPLIDWKARYAVAPWLVLIEPDPNNGLAKPSGADAFQVRSLSQERLVRRLGRLTPSQMKSISAALSLVLSIEP